ncbi:arrestin domain-containing protein 17-like [Physella acuta]|uniref:arrestin domain-containing protein 17-like n=1 Tax=Physella acuta TaxID=109671 RepID=UPI0027DB2D6B|nr:arrestin domain-containing protein 17-like [Physella acuta]XP_059165750.1 arrestin domain-containing protein 17-like [Physella acuta]
MGKLKIFEISFGNGSGVYFPGNAVDGHVTIELKKSMKMRGLRLKFEGKAHVYWSEESGTGDDKKTYYYSATEKYFDQEVLLFGIWPNQGSEAKELPSGRHTFPFQFILPLGLPSSYEAGIGYVRYIVTCNIDRPWKFDPKTKRPFTIIALLDLNQQPNCMQPLQATSKKHLCCLCCKSGPIEATFKIERQGFVPGEAIKLFAEISNGSNRKMSKSYVDLKMISTFRATNKTKIVVRNVARVTRPPIEKQSEDTWSGEELVIPPLPPSFLAGCNIIDVRYVLQLNVDPSGLGLDLEVPFEIIIGSVPLMSVVQMFPPMLPPPQIMDRMYAWGTVPSAPATEDLYPYPPPSGIPNLPPPSYNECITGRYNITEEGDDEHTTGKLEYTPVYPYYNWGHTPGALPDGGA